MSPVWRRVAWVVLVAVTVIGFARTQNTLDRQAEQNAALRSQNARLTAVVATVALNTERLTRLVHVECVRSDRGAGFRKSLIDALGELGVDVTAMEQQGNKIPKVACR